MHRRILLVALLISAMLVPASCGGEKQPKEITLAMGYIPSVQFAPFYVAVEKGYYAKEGIKVNFKYGMESDLVKLVGTNQIPFMVGSGEEVVLGRSQGLPVTYVMQWYRKFPVVVFSLKEKGITKPKDLEGKTLGIPGLYGASYIGWKALVYSAGIDESKVTLESIGYTQATAVSTGKVDAALDYYVSGPLRLRMAGKKVNVIFVSDYIDLPSNGIITNETMIRKHPDLVRAMVHATLRGLKDTLSNPDEAFKISLKYAPEAGKDEEQKKVNRAMFDEVLKLWRVKGGELGLSDPASWEATTKFMEKSHLVDRPVDPKSCYTNEFVR